MPDPTPGLEWIREDMQTMEARLSRALDSQRTETIEIRRDMHALVGKLETKVEVIKAERKMERRWLSAMAAAIGAAVAALVTNFRAILSLLRQL